MKRLPRISLYFVFLGCCVHAQAETIYPTKGQSAQQVQQDVNECRRATASTAPPPPPGTSQISGGRVRGAAVGAAAGAVGAEVRGRRHDDLYDQVDDSVKQDYRQNNAKSAAATGVIIGGARQRQERRQERRENQAQVVNAQSTSSAAYLGCLQGRGYSVTP
ncbi:hypothetical protein ACIQVE_01550 [Pseudomonas sp. NPDC098747]|uniref:hypothetical protein n=1 Tax=Pseudomonas sp. NPDC098747 TaxID=3364487 RepID=UPI003839FEDF